MNDYLRISDYYGMLATLIPIGPTFEDFLEKFVLSSFLWVPLIFAAYAIGRKRVGIRFFFIFAAVEAVALWLALHLEPSMFYEIPIAD